MKESKVYLQYIGDVRQHEALGTLQLRLDPLSLFYCVCFDLFQVALDLSLDPHHLFIHVL